MYGHKLIVCAAWIFLIFTIFATLSSIAWRPKLSNDETNLIVFIERFGAYAVLAILFRLSCPNHIRAVSVLVLGSAVSLELMQTFIPGRDALILDVLEKLAGGVAGIAAINTIQSFCDRRDWKI